MDVNSPLNIVINGKAHEINVSNVDTLLTVLRDDLGFKSVSGEGATARSVAAAPCYWMVSR